MAPRRWPAAAVVLVVLSLALFLLGRFVHVPGLDDVFGVDTQDRSGPAVLKSIQDMHRYEGAAGNYQVVVDLEKDARLLPDSIRGLVRSSLRAAAWPRTSTSATSARAV